MSRELSTGVEQGTEAQRFSKWDWLVLPALSLATILFIAGSIYLIDKCFFSEAQDPHSRCLAFDRWNEPVGIPNSVCWIKGAEMRRPVEYRFNSCGHRTAGECRTKPPGVYRIVLIGSSTGMGFTVPVESTFAALLPAELSRQTGRKVEVYNEAIIEKRPQAIVSGFDEVLGAHPDLILWALTPSDVEYDTQNSGKPFAGPPGLFPQVRWRIRQELATKPAWRVALDTVDILRVAFHDSHLAFPIQHYLDKSQSEYVRLILMGDRSAGYLRSNQDAFWQAALRHLDAEMARMGEEASAAHVPFSVALFPDSFQAAMISMGSWPRGYDPYNLDKEVQTIVTRHGGIYLDILPGMRDIPNPEQDYLPIDGHPDARAHAIFTSLIAQQLTSGAIPALSAGIRQSATVRGDEKGSAPEAAAR